MPESNILSFLLTAFWLGKLEVFPPEGDTPVDPLIFFNGLRSNPGDQIIFLEPCAKRPAEMTYLQDGSIVVDVAHYIPWPIDASELERLEAYKELAAVPASKYPAHFLQAFHTHWIRQDDLAVLCDSTNARRPSFWFISPASRNPTKINHLVKFRKFLRQEFASNIRQPKDRVWTDAKQRFPSLSHSAFDREWAELAPPYWRKGGRPKAKSRSGFCD